MFRNETIITIGQERLPRSQVGDEPVVELPDDPRTGAHDAHDDRHLLRQLDPEVS